MNSTDFPRKRSRQVTALENISFTLKKDPLNPVYLYIQKKSATENQPATKTIEKLLEAGPAFEVERLYHEKYRCGEINLDEMAETLGVPHQKLSQIMEELGLTA